MHVLRKPGKQIKVDRNGVPPRSSIQEDVHDFFWVLYYTQFENDDGTLRADAKKNIVFVRSIEKGCENAV